MPPSTHGRPSQSHVLTEFILRGVVYKRGDYIYLDPEERTDPYFIGIILDIFKTDKPLIKPSNGAAFLSDEVPNVSYSTSDILQTYVHVSWFLRLAEVEPAVAKRWNASALTREPVGGETQKPLSRTSSSTQLSNLSANGSATTGNSGMSTRRSDAAANATISTTLSRSSSSATDMLHTMDARLLFASMHSDVNPIGAIRGKCTVTHLSELLSPVHSSTTSHPKDASQVKSQLITQYRQSLSILNDYRAKEDCFYFWQAYDRYTHALYDVLPTLSLYLTQWIQDNALPALLPYPYCLVETSSTLCLRPEEAAKRYCTLCQTYCGCNDTLLYVRCGECDRFYHRGCLDPPLPFSGIQNTRRYATRGFAWYCPSCAGQLDGFEGDAASAAHALVQQRRLSFEKAQKALTVDPRSLSNNASLPLINTIYRSWSWRYYGLYSREGDDFIDEETCIFPVTRSRIGKSYQAVIPDLMRTKAPEDSSMPASMSSSPLSNTVSSRDEQILNQSQSVTEESEEVKVFVNAQKILTITPTSLLSTTPPTTKMHQGKCIWQCDRLPEQDVDVYVMHMKAMMQVLAEKSQEDTLFRHLRWSDAVLEEALHLLHLHQYDTGRTLSSLLLNAQDEDSYKGDAHEKQTEKQAMASFVLALKQRFLPWQWISTDSNSINNEWTLLKRGLATYGSQLSVIRKAMMPHVKLKDLIQAYYELKCSKAFREERDVAKQQKRIEATTSLYPDTDTDTDEETQDNDMQGTETTRKAAADRALRNDRRLAAKQEEEQEKKEEEEKEEEKKETPLLDSELSVASPSSSSSLSFSQLLLKDRRPESLVCSCCLTLKSHRWKLAGDDTPFKIAKALRSAEQSVPGSPAADSCVSVAETTMIRTVPLSPLRDRPLLCAACARHLKRYNVYPDVETTTLGHRRVMYEKTFGRPVPGMRSSSSRDMDSLQMDKQQQQHSLTSLSTMASRKRLPIMTAESQRDTASSSSPLSLEDRRSKKHKQQQGSPLLLLDGNGKKRGRVPSAPLLLKRAFSSSLASPLSSTDGKSTAAAVLTRPSTYRQLVLKERAASLKSWLVKATQSSSSAIASVVCCSVCLDPEGGLQQSLYECVSCRLCFHAVCYGIPAGQDPSVWRCAPCQNDQSPAVTTNYTCVLCLDPSAAGGALKRTVENHWVHSVCALFTEGVLFSQNESLEPVQCIGKLSREARECDYAECPARKMAVKSASQQTPFRREGQHAPVQSRGVCIPCRMDGCTASIHPTCLLSKIKQDVTTWCQRCIDEEKEKERVEEVSIISSSSPVPSSSFSSSSSAWPVSWCMEVVEGRAMAWCPAHAAGRTNVERVEQQASTVSLTEDKHAFARRWKFRVGLNRASLQNFIYQYKRVRHEQQDDRKIHSVCLADVCHCHEKKNAGEYGSVLPSNTSSVGSAKTKTASAKRQRQGMKIQATAVDSKEEEDSRMEATADGVKENKGAMKEAVEKRENTLVKDRKGMATAEEAVALPSGESSSLQTTREKDRKKGVLEKPCDLCQSTVTTMWWHVMTEVGANPRQVCQRCYSLFYEQ